LTVSHNDIVLKRRVQVLLNLRQLPFGPVRAVGLLGDSLFLNKRLVTMWSVCI